MSYTVVGRCLSCSRTLATADVGPVASVNASAMDHLGALVARHVAAHMARDGVPAGVELAFSSTGASDER